VPFSLEEPLPEDSQVFRAYSYENHVEKLSRRPTTKLFLRRAAPKDEDGLSVGPSAAECVQHLAYHYGCCGLILCEIKLIEGLDVVADAEDHANITGLPRRTDDEGRALKRALELAENLRRIARTDPLPPNPPLPKPETEAVPR
jgi:hypothetical protein